MATKPTKVTLKTDPSGKVRAKPIDTAPAHVRVPREKKARRAEKA